MHTPEYFEPVDYLVVGHITQDITPDGLILGGTASYASLTALALGVQVGIVTSCSPTLDLSLLKGIQLASKPSPFTSTFENIYTPAGRIQHIHHVASELTLADVPGVWLNTPVVHLGPLTNEISPELAQGFLNSLIGVTPQGWMRTWDASGVVSFQPWQDANKVLPVVDAAVMSIEDVRGNEDVVAEFATLAKILVVTEGAAGCRVYWNGDVRYFRPPLELEVDPVGAGDVFAASFFIRLHHTNDPWEAARFATLVAANSVTRKGITGVPTTSEVQRFLTEIIGYPVK